jgi:hypothetical protein
VIGDYYLSFNKRSEYVYKTKTDCYGFSIRKKNWKSVIQDNPNIADELLEQIELNYKRLIQTKMDKNIEKFLDKQRHRADYESILRVVHNDEIDQLKTIKEKIK